MSVTSNAITEGKSVLAEIYNVLCLSYEVVKNTENFGEKMLEFITTAIMDRTSYIVLMKFFKDSQTVAEVAPSSKLTIDCLTGYIDDSIHQDILEMGFGSGGITREIIRKRNESSVLHAIDVTESFYKDLNDNIRDENVLIALCPAEKWTNDKKYDIIVSTIPFITLMSSELSKEILENVVNLLKPGGIFTYIRYVFGRSVSDLEKISGFDQLLQDYFTLETVDYCLMNIPPTYIFHYRRNSVERS